MLTAENTVLVVIDVQGKLARLMCNSEILFKNLQKIIKGAKILEIPIIWTEQNPEKIGPTINEIAKLVRPVKPISKASFSCFHNEVFMRTLESLSRNQILLTGIESHICVYQTAVDLVNSGYEVYVVEDAISSRVEWNKKIALESMQNSGVKLTCTEMALFEILKVAEGNKFKEILKLIK